MLIEREAQFREMEISCMANLSPENTGLPMLIYISCKVGVSVSLFPMAELAFTLTRRP